MKNIFEELYRIFWLRHLIWLIISLILLVIVLILCLIDPLIAPRPSSEPQIRELTVRIICIDNMETRDINSRWANVPAHQNLATYFLIAYNDEMDFTGLQVGNTIIITGLIYVPLDRDSFTAYFYVHEWTMYYAVP